MLLYRTKHDTFCTDCDSANLLLYNSKNGCRWGLRPKCSSLTRFIRQLGSLLALSSDREHVSKPDLSDLRIVGTCDTLVYKMRHEVMWFTLLVDSNLLSICIITCHWNPFNHLAMFSRFSKMYKCRKYYHYIAKYCNTNHCYGLAIKGDWMSPQMDYL